jgi:hypothetical protein
LFVLFSALRDLFAGFGQLAARLWRRYTREQVIQRQAALHASLRCRELYVFMSKWLSDTRLR